MATSRNGPYAPPAYSSFRVAWWTCQNIERSLKPVTLLPLVIPAENWSMEIEPSWPPHGRNRMRRLHTPLSEVQGEPVAPKLQFDTVIFCRSACGGTIRDLVPSSFCPCLDPDNPAEASTGLHICGRISEWAVCTACVLLFQSRVVDLSEEQTS